MAAEPAFLDTHSFASRERNSPGGDSSDYGVLPGILADSLLSRVLCLCILYYLLW